MFVLLEHIENIKHGSCPFCLLRCAFAALSYNIPQSYPIFQVVIEKLLILFCKYLYFSGCCSSLLWGKREPEILLAPVARGWFFLLVKWLALRAGRAGGAGQVFFFGQMACAPRGPEVGRGVSTPPPYLWTPLSPQRVKGCSPLTIPKKKSKRKKASRFAKTVAAPASASLRSHLLAAAQQLLLFPPLAAVVAVAHFLCFSIYGSAEDFTFLLDVTVSRDVTPAAKQQIGETRKKRLAQRLAFFRFDNSFGV